jgi:hypothetical protein
MPPILCAIWRSGDALMVGLDGGSTTMTSRSRARPITKARGEETKGEE